MSTTSFLVTRDGALYAVLSKRDDWGTASYDLARPPRRFWADQNASRPAVEVSVDARRVAAAPTPAQLLGALPPDDNWQAQSRRSLARLWAHFLVCEDPQRRMDARPVATLSHQVSLVQHILETEHLRRVLVADEVGLGKTVEAGLLLAELFRAQPSLRVLYLAPARLVDNVAREFDRLRLDFRRWKAGDSEARLSDPRIIGSIHRAVHGRRFDEMLAAQPWDVLVVDECHHLSDWAPGGGSPREKYRLVEALAERQAPGSRLLLLSGTPHQGHMPRFENLLRLLQWPNEKQADLRGRVIYRTKEDIRDWRGNPVFPNRQVNEPIVLNLGQAYRRWLENIHDFYKPPQDSQLGQARQRAAGWRAAQALQWAASSPQAGLGYLVRQAIRAGWTLEQPEFATALAALRPYRHGSADEPMAELFARLNLEIQRQRIEGDVEDIEDEEGDDELRDAERDSMAALLREGAEVLRRAGDEKWRVLKERVLDQAGDEKVVLFAQPIETVIALARWLEQTTGERPAIIIGGQSDAERRQEEDRFRKANGPRYLVSSRAGGEGINLQVARRLVHVDVPWNPMELEQRVGRVHRFGSRRTILVDTLVVGESREADAYRIARRKLQTIAATLRPGQFEMLFSRVMALVPPEELQSVLLEEPVAPLSDTDTARLSAMVESGYHAWKGFHEQFHEQQRQIRQLDGGLVTWEDIEEFLVKFAGAEAMAGFQAQRFEIVQGQSEARDEEVRVLRLRDGAAYAAGDTQGAPVFGPADEEVRQLGLNSAPVAAALRECAFPKLPTGAAHLRLGPGWRPASGTLPAGVLVFVVQLVQVAQHESWQEQSARIVTFEVDAAGGSRAIEGEEKGRLLRTLFDAAPRVKAPSETALVAALAEAERRLFLELWQTSDDLRAVRARYAVTPLLAAIVGE